MTTKTIIPGVPEGTAWEMKDRVYYLTTREQPLVFSLPSKHTQRKPLLWFDPVKGYQRELRTLGRIVFRDGALAVPKRFQSLQKMLSIFHPLKGVIYQEHDEVEVATYDLEYMEQEIEALTTAKDLEIDIMEGILRVEIGSKVSSMSSKEIKRDLLLFAKNNPTLFLDLVKDDNVQLRNFGIKATEANLIKLSPDNRQFTWASNGRKLMTVPFDEHPYTALAAWFQTDEGLEVYDNLEKRLK
jgi:hypothetical protein